jgi:hypothetical protein
MVTSDKTSASVTTATTTQKDNAAMEGVEGTTSVVNNGQTPGQMFASPTGVVGDQIKETAGGRKRSTWWGLRSA